MLKTIDSDDINLLALCSVPLIGPVLQRRLISAFGSPKAVFGASSGDLLSVEGISLKRAESIKGFRGWEGLEKSADKLKKDGIKIAAWGAPSYPSELNTLGDDAPLVIYVKGEIISEDRFAVAVVGSRTPTPYGVNVAETLAQDLAAMGITVVSGLARGIDSAAHKGSIRCGGRTIAVLGSGIDVPYPAENRGLMERMSRSGAAISEFPPGTKPLRENFPRRNRLISGLSLGVVVVEAALKSGALITSECALEQGKEVFAVPGNINSAFSDGANLLIRQGAKIVMSAQDILEELAPKLKGFIKAVIKDKAAVSGEEKAICDIMSRAPKHIDIISRESGLAVSKAMALLLGLEIKGIVKQTGGMNFNLV